ncbi:L-type lectin-domain containing receptor kinase I.8-like [Pistacia vera]|uniref:L-type lectin-domain containing receptor kinase I.8-like n=1 Tax=Pistacia vera TaxID=55513 RepID=UPI0012633E7F|nr:L-type lectin-domain containing receptor kinase I.8-like [Pistacia vera]
MAAAQYLYLWVVFNLSLFLALAKEENQFIYHGFNNSKLQLGGLAKILPNGLLRLTNTSELESGYAFYPSPFKFNSSSSQTLSFSTTFVFAMVSKAVNFGGNGLAFFISPSMNFTGAVAGAYLGLFNLTNNGQPTNHILAVELDTVESPEFYDIDGNHVGIDVNSLISNQSATASYFSNKEEKNETLELGSGKPNQIWIDYDGTEKLFNVTIAPLKIPKPNRSLLSKHLDLSEVLLESMYVGLSAATGTRISDHYILGWSFNKSGPAQNLDVSKLPPPPPPEKTSEGLDRTITVLLVAIAVVLITVGVAIYIVRKKKYEEVYEDWEKEYGPHRLSYKKLYKATKGFKEKEFIGQGGFGQVYRGVLPSNVQIAVKRINHNSNEGMKQFVAEIVSMRRLRHRNLVQLRGYCRRRGELLLVYDYMPNGSLDKILYVDTKANLNWFQRFRILRGVASGLLYLHEEWEQVVLHRDIKAANVLLDADLNGKLGDFGLARLHDHGSNAQTTSLVGTVGYLAPELLQTGKATTSTDVFAFGAFMLEVACGRRPIEPGMVDLAAWVIDCWKRGAILGVSDPRLEGMYVEEQMELVLKLGLLCSHSNPETRPSMKQVTQYLDGEAKLPSITPESAVIGAITARNEVPDIVFSFDSLPESTSSHTLSSVDSILVLGR